jgi:F-type H+-transporting ATPase subunit delta
MNKDQSAVAAKYAEAIMQLAKKEHCEQALLDDLTLVNQVVAAMPELNVVLSHPAVSPADKKQLIATAFSGKVNDLTQRLMGLLADRRRLELAPSIEHEYKRLWRESQNIVTATLTFVERPGATDMAVIRAKVKQLVGGKEVELEEKEDKSLIGGFTLRIGDQILDGSLKGRLAKVEKALLSV